MYCVEAPIPEPPSTMFPLESNDAVWPLVKVPEVVPKVVVFPLRAPDDGAVPAPPPMTGLFAVNRAEDESTELLEKYGTPPLVPLRFTLSVPELVTGLPVTAKTPEDEPPFTENPVLVTVPVPPVVMV